MIRSTAITLLAATLAASARADITEFYRYEFAIQVTQNTVASSGTGGELATLALGTQGVLAIDVNPDRDVFPSSFTDEQTYQVLDVNLSVGTIATGAAPGVYPSAALVPFNFTVENDGLIGGNSRIQDSIGGILAFANPEFGLSGFSIIEQNLVDDGIPGMVTSTDAPLAIDLSDLLSPTHLTIGSALPGGGSVGFEFFDVTITVIPAPASSAALALAALTAARRRR